MQINALGALINELNFPNFKGQLVSACNVKNINLSRGKKTKHILYYIIIL